jgi:hypothetical protein
MHDIIYSHKGIVTTKDVYECLTVLRTLVEKAFEVVQFLHILNPYQAFYLSYAPSVCLFPSEVVLKAP